jgi:hypothetical protein
MFAESFMNVVASLVPHYIIGGKGNYRETEREEMGRGAN